MTITPEQLAELEALYKRYKDFSDRCETLSTDEIAKWLGSSSAVGQALKEHAPALIAAARQNYSIATDARQFDLVRFMRSELAGQGLISGEEYAWLCLEAPLAKGNGSPSPRRLESYDEARRTLEQDRDQWKERAEAAELEVARLNDDIAQMHETAGQGQGGV